MRKTLFILTTRTAIAALACSAQLSACAAHSAETATTGAINPAYSDPIEPALPQTSMEFTLADTALVITDPQIDFLDPSGVAWGAVGASVEEQGTVDNLEALFAASRDAGMLTFVSPHYYFPHDHEWEFEGALEKLMHNIGMFDRPDQLSLEGFEGSGADFMPQYKEYLAAENVVITSPHKVYGPEQNDLVLQLRKRGISKVILAGMSANLCTQAHMHELLEQGFEVTVVRDATAGAIIPEGDGYLAALINFRFMANEVVFTEDAVERITSAP